MVLTSQNYVDTNFIKKNSNKDENGIDNNIVGSVGISGNTTIKHDNTSFKVSGIKYNHNAKIRVGDTGLFFQGGHSNLNGDGPDNMVNVTYAPGGENINEDGGLFRTTVDDGIKKDYAVLSYDFRDYVGQPGIKFYGDIKNNQGASFKPTKIVTTQYIVQTPNGTENKFLFPISHIGGTIDLGLSNTTQKWDGHWWDPYADTNLAVSDFCNDTDYESPGFCYLRSSVMGDYSDPNINKIISIASNSNSSGTGNIWYLEVFFPGNMNFTSGVDEIYRTIEIQCVLNPNFKD